MFNMLLADFNTEVLPIIRFVIIGIIFLCAVVLIISTLLQSSADENGATALTGQDSYYSQNKGESRDGKLRKTTIITGIIIAVATVLYFVTWLIMV
ncbi:MAG: hypothetical protein E7378_01055 [Clostridiales bacterium]|nr:hypothetical protein [Clostridiales bacterium]